MADEWETTPEIKDDVLVVHKKLGDNDLLYIFLDNLHDFSHEGSLNSDQYADLALIGLFVAYAFSDNIGEVGRILTLFITAIVDVLPDKRAYFYEGNDLKREPSLLFLDILKNRESVGELPEMANFLTKDTRAANQNPADSNAQKYLYKKIYENGRLFVKNPVVYERSCKYDKTSQIYSLNTKKRELTPMVEIVTPDKYLDQEHGKETESFVETPAWNALLNASCKHYDGSDVFGRIDILQDKVEVNKDLIMTLDNYMEAIKKKKYSIKHKWQIFFDNTLGAWQAEEDKIYLFGPDAVNKVRAMSSVFHNMQRYHKFGLSQTPLKQTIHNTAINFDMANSTITKPIAPMLGSFQEYTHTGGKNVAEMFEMPIHTYLYSPEGTKRMVIKQTPFKSDKPLKFANHVYSVYNNLLIQFHTELSIAKEKSEGQEDNEYYQTVEKGLINYFKDPNYDTFHSPWKGDYTGDGGNLMDWTVLANRQIKIGDKTFDLLNDLTIKDGISLFQLISIEAKDFYAELDTDKEETVVNFQAGGIFTDDKARMDDSTAKKMAGKYKYPFMTHNRKAGKPPTMGPQKWYSGFKKSEAIKHLKAGPNNLNDFHAYIIYLFMCDIKIQQGIDEETGAETTTYTKDSFPTHNDSVILTIFLEHYKNIIEGDIHLAQSFPVNQTIHFEKKTAAGWLPSVSEYGQLKQGRKGPSVTYQEYNFRNLILSLSKTYIAAHTGVSNAPLNAGNHMATTKPQLGQFKTLNEKRNPLKETSDKKEKGGAKRASTLPGPIKEAQTDMLKYLFDIIPNLGDDEIGRIVATAGTTEEYENNHHEYIIESLKASAESGEIKDKNKFLEFICNILWMPVATKWTSDFMQTIMNRAVLHIAQESNKGYSNLFSPCTFDITCGSGGIQEGPMMYEKVSSNGVLHATNFDPQQHEKRKKLMLDNKSTILHKTTEEDDNWDKFVKTLLNFAPWVIEDYVRMLTGEDIQEQMEPYDITFIQNIYKHITAEFSDDKFEVNLLTIHWLKKICFKYKSEDETKKYYQYKYLKELLQNTRFLKPVSNLQIEDDEITNQLISIIQELKEIKSDIIKQLLNIEIDIDKKREELNRSYYKYLYDGDKVDFKDYKEMPDEARDDFTNAWLFDFNKTHEYLNMNKEQVIKSIDKMFMYLKTRRTMEDSKRFFDIARVELKTSMTQFKQSNWISGRSGILLGNRLMYYYHPNAQQLDINILPSASGRSSGIWEKYGEETRVELKSPGDGWTLTKERIKTYYNTEVRQNREKREKGYELADEFMTLMEEAKSGNLGDNDQEKGENKTAAETLEAFAAVDYTFRLALIAKLNIEKKKNAETDEKVLKIQILRKYIKEGDPGEDDFDILIGVGFDKKFKKRLTKKQKDKKPWDKKGQSMMDFAIEEGRIGEFLGRSLTPKKISEIMNKYRDKAGQHWNVFAGGILTDATGSGNMFECCSNFLDIPDTKVDIEKLHELATLDSGEVPLDTVKIRGTPKPINDLPQYKYTDALKSFNALDAEGPIDLLADINKGISNTANFLKEYRGLLNMPPGPASPGRLYDGSSPKPQPGSPFTPSPIGALAPALNRSASAQHQEEFMLNVPTFEAALEQAVGSMDMDVDSHSGTSSPTSSPSVATGKKSSEILELEQQLAGERAQYQTYKNGFGKIIIDLQKQMTMLRKASLKKDEARNKRDAAQAKLDKAVFSSDTNKKPKSKRLSSKYVVSPTKCPYCGWLHDKTAPWTDIILPPGTTDAAHNFMNPARGCGYCPVCKDRINFNPTVAGVDTYGSDGGTYTSSKTGNLHPGPKGFTHNKCPNPPAHKGGMKIKIKYNTTQKIRRKMGRKSQNKRKKKGRGSKKHKRRKHRNTHKKALKIEH